TTLSRELQRNPAVLERNRYHPGDAHRLAKARRCQANQRWRKILSNSVRARLIGENITFSKWAPEQIAGWLKTFRRSLDVRAQTIYDWVYTRRKDLVDYLHCRKGRYRRTRQARLRMKKRAELAAPRNIAQRPKHIA